MNNEIIEKYKLEVSLPTLEADAFKKLLEKANESYVLLWEVKKDIVVCGFQYYKFEVFCPKINFAHAYFHVGLLWSGYVLPIWKKRFNLKGDKVKSNKLIKKITR